MRLPSESALSKEQKEVISAPTEGTILVVGPPGSGKTVVAVMRERTLKKRKEKVVSVVFTNVLTRYTGNPSTFDTWLQEWWQAATKSRWFPSVVHTDDAGARHWTKDYAAASAEALSTKKAGLRKLGNWHHLVLDEAQDFPADAHSFLFKVQHRVFGDLPEEDRPSICILADENQRLTQFNSTILQIKKSHITLTAQDEYQLTQNYRNTIQIAEFASHFYVGLASGKPLPPKTHGDIPKITSASLDEAVERIATYARNHPNEEVGVLTYNNKTRHKLFNKLNHRLKPLKLRVQTYGTKPESDRDPANLIFDKPGTVTCLCFASAKGLEFDTVFLPELQAIPIDGDNRDQIRMNLYVMCSRARKQLWLFIDAAEGTHPVWQLLPPPHLWRAES